MEPLQGQPAERGQKGVVKSKSHVNAETSGGQCCHLLTGEEVDVEENQSNSKVDVNLHRDIRSDLSVRQRRSDLW